MMKLSLKALFLLLFVIAVASLFVLSTLALVFNYQLAQNQNYLLKATTIETSRFMMSSSLSKFLARQGTILFIHNADEFSQLPPRHEIEQQFKQGLQNLTNMAKFNPEVTEALQSIQENYQKFLTTDQQLLNLSQSLVTLGDRIQTKARTVDEEVRNIRSLADNISGKLVLQDSQNKLLIAEALNKKNLDRNFKWVEFKNAVNQSNDLTTAERSSEKLNTDIVTLNTLMRQLIQESNPDILTSLKNNQIVQLIELIRRELIQINDKLQNQPSFIPITIDMTNQVNVIAGQLIEAPQNIFELRKEYNDKEIKVKQTITQIQKYLFDITIQFNQLDTVVTQLKTKLLKTAEVLTLKNRITVISTVIIVLIFMILVGYYVQKAMSTSLTLLTSAMEKIAEEEGGLEYRLSLTKYIDLNRVVTAFNKMANNLHFTQSHLHELVESKTEQLSEANKHLEKLMAEIKNAKEESGSANKIKSEFLGNMSHELQTSSKAQPLKTETIKQGKTILIIDDDPELHQELQSSFVEAKYTVLHAFNGEEGLTLASKHNPDVIILDVIMPVMDGWTTLSALKSNPHLADIPVIILTISDEKDLGLTLGAIDYIHKPANPAELVARIKQLLRPKLLL